MTAEPILTARGLSRIFRSGTRTVTALHDVDIDLMPGETLGVVGVSGSGKSTLARALVRLVELDAGTIRVAGQDFLCLRGSALRAARRWIQMVFQDPATALNPRATVRGAIADPIRIHRLASTPELPAAVARLLERVGLPASIADRSVRDISGGQRQRVAIARALATRPAVMILDEPVSALDLSVRGQILNLLLDLQATEGLAYIFISHDMGVVRALADRVSVMASGRIVEAGTADQIFTTPSAPETCALIDAVPRLRAI